MNRTSLSRLLIAITALCSAPAIVAQTTSFMLKNYPAPNFSAIGRGDFNNDGIPDVVGGGGGLTTYPGNGDGTFGAPVTTADTSQLTELAIGDFNRDGNLDVAAVDFNNNLIKIYRGNGNGTFQPPISLTPKSEAISLTVADFDGDGVLDLAVAEEGPTNAVEIFRGQGNGDFASVKFLTGFSDPQLNLIRAGDFNKDGKADFALSGIQNVYAFLNNGGFNFTQKNIGFYTTVRSMNTGDLNQDGYSDIMVGYDCSGGNNTCGGIDAYYGQGDGSLFRRNALVDHSVEPPGAIYAADVNGDGLADLAALDLSDSTLDGLYIWLQNPDGSFQQTPQAYIYTTDRDKYVLVPGDWNRDGMIDFAAMLPGSGTMEALLNASPRAACTRSMIPPAVTVCDPIDLTYSNSTVAVSAETFDNNQVTGMHLYIDNNDAFSTSGSFISERFMLPAGDHFLVAKAWDTTGISFRSDRHITIFNGTPGQTCSVAPNSARICLPVEATSGSPVRILANGDSSTVPTAVQLYVDNQLVVNSTQQNSYVDTSLPLAAGSHLLVFKLWDAQGNAFVDSKTVQVQ